MIPRYDTRIKQAGFTLVDLTVATAIFILMLGVVLANLRGVNRHTLPLALQELTSGIVAVQTMGLAGQLFSEADPTYPTGGYGIVFSTCTLGGPACGYTVFGDTDSDGSNDSGETITNGSKTVLNGNYVTRLHYTTNSQVPPPFGPGWQAVSSGALQVLFNQGETVVYFSGDPEPQTTITYIGLEIENSNDGRRGYVYISAKTGLINSGLLP